MSHQQTECFTLKQGHESVQHLQQEPEVLVLCDRNLQSDWLILHQWRWNRSFWHVSLSVCQSHLCSGWCHSRAADWTQSQLAATSCWTLWTEEIHRFFMKNDRQIYSTLTLCPLCSTNLSWPNVSRCLQMLVLSPYVSLCPNISSGILFCPFLSFLSQSLQISSVLPFCLRLSLTETDDSFVR